MLKIIGVYAECDVKKCRAASSASDVRLLQRKGWDFIGFDADVAVCPTHAKERNAGAALQFRIEATKKFSGVDIGALDGGDDE